MPDITKYSPGSGRKIKEDGTLVNVAEKIEAMAAKLDLSITDLRDALAGAGVAAKTIADLNTVLAAIKDTDGIKKILDTVNVSLTGSTGTIPDSQAIPIKNRAIIVSQIGTNVVVAAGTTVTVYSSTAQTDGPTSVAFAVRETDFLTHNFTISLVHYADTPIDFAIRVDSTAVTGNDRAAVTKVDTHTDYQMYKILNQDSVSHTYNVINYTWRR